MPDKMKRPVTYTLAFIALWAIWYLLCPYYLQRMEGFNFYTDLPDFRNLNMDIKDSVFIGISSYLMQFYAYPALGATINAFISILMVLAADLTVRQIFKEPKCLLWISFPTLLLITNQLFKEVSLVPALKCLSIAFAVCVVSYLTSFWKKGFIPMPKLLRSIWLEGAMVVVILTGAGYMVHDKLVKSGSEEISHLDYLVEQRDWNKILEKVPAEYARQNGTIRKYALLALSEKGILVDNAIAYGLNGSDDFMFHGTAQPMLRNFNMMFYNCLGMHNVSIYYAYQQASQFYVSLNFNAARSLADTYLQIKDHTLAEKYLEILSHSTCHKKWVSERMDKLEAIKGETPERMTDDKKHIWGKMVPDMYLMIEKHSDDRRYRDYLLCGLLVDRQAQLFYKAFQELYSEDEQIPFLYQEALLTIIGRQPEEMSRYEFSPEVLMAFRDFEQMIMSGRGTNAKRKYAATYWAYLFFTK